MTRTSLFDCVELYEMRKMIESYAIDILARSRLHRFTAIESALARSSAVLGLSSDDAGEKLAFLKAFADFHLALVQSAGNSRLTHSYVSIYSNLLRYQFMFDSVLKTTQLSQEEHDRIFKLLKLSAFGEARQRSMAHIDSYLELLQDGCLWPESKSGTSNKPNRGY